LFVLKAKVIPLMMPFNCQNVVEINVHH